MVKPVEEELSYAISKEELIYELTELGYKVLSVSPSVSSYRLEARRYSYHLIMYAKNNKQKLQLHKDVGKPHRAIVSNDVKEELEKIKNRLNKYKT